LAFSTKVVQKEKLWQSLAAFPQAAFDSLFGLFYKIWPLT
jgi:hypothetical protein